LDEAKNQFPSRIGQVFSGFQLIVPQDKNSSDNPGVDNPWENFALALQNHQHPHLLLINSLKARRPNGKALVFGTKDCAFESRVGRLWKLQWLRLLFEGGVQTLLTVEY
jgi:hypothetical protein